MNHRTPKGRLAEPSQTSGAKRRFPNRGGSSLCASRLRPGQAAAKVGHLRRGIPTHSFRRALPRHLCVWCSPSFQKVGTARRAVPNLRREAPFPEQGRLQPMRLATPAWQAAVKNGTPVARHPYQFLSKGAAAPFVYSTSPLVPKGRDGSPSRPTFGRSGVSPAIERSQGARPPSGVPPRASRGGSEIL